MDCPIQVVLGVVMRRSMYHLQEVLSMVVEVGTALPMAARLSGTVFRRMMTPLSSVGAGSTHY
jgi:hypothetical protein